MVVLCSRSVTLLLLSHNSIHRVPQALSILIFDDVCTLFMCCFLLFLAFSVLVANPRKVILHGGQSRSWSAEQEKRKGEKVWQHTPSSPLLVQRKKKSHDASACLGATQVSVRLVSVQGFLGLVG